MKDLIIPFEKQTSVDIAEIGNKFKGLIIAYKGDNPVGYIQYADDEWFLVNSINDFDSDESDKDLLYFVRSLIENKICTHFKVIEFK